MGPGEIRRDPTAAQDLVVQLASVQGGSKDKGEAARMAGEVTEPLASAPHACSTLLITTRSCLCLL